MSQSFPTAAAQAANTSNIPAKSISSHKTAPTGHSGGGEIPSQFSSLNELKEKAPEVWNMMMMMVAQSICSQMKSQSDNLKKIIREGRRNS